MVDISIERAAVGRIAFLGDLYDAQRDMFCNMSLFKTSIPSQAIQTMDNQYSDIHLVYNDSIKEKFLKMKIDADLQASLLSGLVSPQGSGIYLTETKTSEKAVQCSLVYRITTIEEAMNINYDDLDSSVSLSALDGTSATHMVTGITWGAYCVLTCTHQNKERLSTYEISGKLNTQLAMLETLISSGGRLNGENYEDIKSTDSNFEVVIVGDILPENDSALPTTIPDAIHFLQKFPSLIKNCNSGKGKPLQYRLIPISYIRNKLSKPLNIEQKLHSIDNAILHRIVYCFGQLAASTQKLNDILEDISIFKCCTHQEISNIANLKRQVEIDGHNLRAKLQGILVDVRSGVSDMSKLDIALAKFETHNTYPENIPDIIPYWNTITENIAFVRTLKQHDVIYVGSDTSLNAEVENYLNQTAFVLYYNNNFNKKDPEVWSQTRNLFFRELTKSNTCHKYYAVDCEIHPNTLDETDEWCCMKIFRDGKIHVANVFQELQQFQDTAYVQSTSEPNKLALKPNKRVTFSTPCFGNSCNATFAYDWACRKCQEILEYGFDDNVYCSCGQTNVANLEFKCSDTRHGITYEKPDLALLFHRIRALRPFKELNILILGETGVGKSTFINGFANFLRYQTLEDAEKADLCSIIPSQFTVCNERFEEIIVSTGSDPNEVHQPGQSATQQTRVYPFQIGDSTVRLIDTPGIGDTRGIEHDESNFENILGVLSHLDEIHGVCILLKPNNSRLNIMFRFCIKELLTNLHRDASKNILFCFTNSRGTFYRPGDTLPALRKLLSENNQVEIPISFDTVYCFDSEAYRFLAAIKNKPPVKFRNDDRENFLTSWEKSVAETQRMVQHIMGLEPHKIKNTISLNHARELVLKLSRPLAEISRNIEMNKLTVEEEKLEIQKTHANIDDLRKRMRTTKTELDVQALGSAQTVCSNKKCVRTITVNNTEFTDHYVICHDRCGLGVGSGSIGSLQFIRCAAMKWGTCKVCGHSFREHLQIFHRTVQITLQFDDPEICKLLDKNLSAADIKQELLDIKDTQLKEYEYELEEIEKSSVLFAYFLKTNAITPYNDSREQYLTHFIREEESKVAQGNNRWNLDRLKQNLASYCAQKTLLEQKMAESGSHHGAPAPEDIYNIVKKLQSLKHSGKSLKESLECVEKTQNTIYKEVIVQPFFQPKQDKASKSTTGVSGSQKGRIRRTLFDVLLR